MDATYHWISKIEIGEGTLKEFKEQYDNLNTASDQFVTASQVFPRTVQGSSVNNFSWIIYYKVKPR